MKTKLSPEMFLEKAELSRFEQGLRDDGFVFNKVVDTRYWGIIKNKTLNPSFNYFKIVGSANPNQFRVSKGYAFDKNRNIIYNKYDTLDITIPQQGISYWVKISYISESREVGVVSIGGTNQGLMTGVGTKFTEVLRGQPNFPSKIKFLNSTHYPLEYNILEVIDDNNVVVQGIFDLVEPNLQYAVVGTFTPGIQPLTQNKQPFQYDSCLITLIQATGPNFPALIDGMEFIIGQVSYDLTGFHYFDYRYAFSYTSLERNFRDNISQIDKLAGIQSVKRLVTNFRHIYVSRIDWKLNITSEVQSNSLNIVTITSGYGGAWLNITPFVSGDFDGWRYYYTDGNYNEILSSTKVGSTIVLVLDGVRIGSGAGIYVTPNAEDIQVRAIFLDQSSAYIYEKSYAFSITQNSPTLIFTQDEILYSSQVIKLFFTLKNHFKRSAEIQFNVSTYLNEQAFDDQGTQIGNQSTTSASISLLNTIVPSNSFFPKRIPVPWSPLNVSEIAAYFDNTGLGMPTGPFVGWAICNGLNTTRNLRGRYIVGATNSLQIPGPTNNYLPEADPSVIGNPNYSLFDNGGAARVVLITNQLPKHKHLITDPEHTHTASDGAGHHHYIDNMSGGFNADGGGFPVWQQPGVGNTTDTSTTHVTITIGSSSTGITETALSGNDESHQNLPPFEALIYVMRIA